MSAPLIPSREVSPALAPQQQPACGMSPAAARLPKRVLIAFFAGIAVAALAVGFMTADRVNDAGCHLPVCGFEGGN